MRRKKYVSVVALVLAILMVLGLVTGVVAGIVAQASSLTEIDSKISQAESELSSLESKNEEIDDQMAELQGKLGALQSEEDSYLEQISLLEEQITLLRERISLTQEQVALYEGMIEEKEAQLLLAEQEEEEQLQRYKLRLRAMEERGSLNYIQILLSAKSFSDLMTKISDINMILEYDQGVFDDLEQSRLAVQEYKAGLEESMAELEDLVARLKADEEELETQIDETQALIDEIQALIDANKVEQEALQAEKDRLNEEMLAIASNLESLNEDRKAKIKEMEEQAAAGETVGSGGVSTGTRAGSGMFMWPSDNSTTITSGFGSRSSPGGIGSTNHQGIDIGASLGTNVLASASGYVERAGWNGGYGNYIMINHGDGNYTAYAHMSALLVSAGDTVIQGQVIGQVGSTGNSTGPHLHFEVYVGGSRVDPAQFF